VILLAFGPEEHGLVGSEVFVENPPFDLREIDVVLNLDMVGRLRRIVLRSSGRRQSSRGFSRVPIPIRHCRW